LPWQRPERLEKEGQIYNLQSNIYILVKKIVKIGPVYPKIIGLQAIVKKERNFTGKLYSPVGTHTGRAN